MALEAYRRKRNFERTPEPSGQAGAKARAKAAPRFTVQKHAARRLHYDFRLEHAGVLLSWAVPKGPSLDPHIKRLAMQTEDHPIEYGTFEGVIPKGEYGGGPVLVWDYGHWIPEGDPDEGLRRGRLTFALEGEKLRGRWHLVRTLGEGGKAWLLFKSADAEARTGQDSEIVAQAPTSVLSGRAIEDVQSDPDRVWRSNREGEGDGSSGLPDLSDVQGAREAALPAFVEPQLATLVDSPPGDGYLHEIKLDGYRVLARIERGRARLLTRRGNDWTERMPSLARAFESLPVDEAMFDGEVVVLAPSGVSDFQRLQNALASGRDEACVYHAFDLLHLSGHDLRKLPLRERKRLLHETLAAVGALQGRIRFSDHEQGDAQAFLEQACKLRLEGIVSKRADAPYTSGRSRAWLKCKCHARQEFVIGGYTDPAGARSHFGALLLGVRDGEGELSYAGKVGTGFSQQSLADLHARLRKLSRSKPPFVDPPRGADARRAHWVQPKLVAEVEYAERTKDGLLRHASFRGLRQDKPASEVRDETPVELARPAEGQPDPERVLARVRFTHPDRVLYADQGITKRELGLYYAKVARRMLPHLAQRPLTLVRCPEGQGKECFFQKHPSQGMPNSVHRVRIREKSASLDYMYVDDIEGLLGLVQVGALEIHTWGSRVDRLECPDQLVFDLDQAPDVPWERMIEAAHAMRERLAAIDLQGFLKTTGGKGLHVVVPIEPRLRWDVAKRFCKLLVESMVRAEPSRYLATMSKSKRKGKIFLDYLRNGRGATAVCAYSTRARPSAPLSLPIAWDELTPELRSDAFDLRSVNGRLVDPDPWQAFEAARAPISAAARRALGMR